eukprot:8563331-Pyramimonas_sp.AAC.1
MSRTSHQNYLSLDYLLLYQPVVQGVRSHCPDISKRCDRSQQGHLAGLDPEATPVDGLYERGRSYKMCY